jgi:putative Mn2+ efflux pump MntP
VADALRLVAVVLPLGLDTFGFGVALGIAGLPRHQRTQVALLFATFEAFMPLVGVAVGAPLGTAIGDAADYIAAVVLIALGGYMLRESDDDIDPGQLLSMTRGGVYGAFALGISISLDELAIGFSAGLLRLPLLPLVLAIGAQAFVVTQVGVRLGVRLGERWRESAARIAGAALIALGSGLLIARIAS